MDKTDLNKAIIVELRHIATDEWHISVAHDAAINVLLPATCDIADTVWQIARFVGYNEFVSIEQRGETFEINSRSGPLSFRIVISNAPTALT
jgi:hypothetical protein